MSEGTNKWRCLLFQGRWASQHLPYRLQLLLIECTMILMCQRLLEGVYPCNQAYMIPLLGCGQVVHHLQWRDYRSPVPVHWTLWLILPTLLGAHRCQPFAHQVHECSFTIRCIHMYVYSFTHSNQLWYNQSHLLLLRNRTLLCCCVESAACGTN